MKACIGCGELLNYPTDHATCLWDVEFFETIVKAKKMDVKEWTKFTEERFEQERKKYSCPKCGSKLLVEGGICIGGCKD